MRVQTFDARYLAHVSTIWLGIVAVLIILHFGRYFLAPLFLAVVLGLMLIPIARRIENFGISSFISAAIVALLFLGLIAAGIYGLAVPLSDWTERLPIVWSKLNALVAEWRQNLSFGKYREMLEQLAINEEAMKVELGDADSVKNAAFMAPAILGQILIFIASLYFFVATRETFRVSVMKLCLSRALRLRVGRVFADIEQRVSSYLLQITLINLCLGTVTALAMWLLGLPSPLLWGFLAAILNYIIYLGPALMAAILLLVGIALGGPVISVILPAMVFLSINFIEANFVTPQFLGRSLTVNPFIVFLALAFWIWMWGPVGGFVAVPSLLIFYSILNNIFGLEPVTRTR